MLLHALYAIRFKVIEVKILDHVGIRAALFDVNCKCGCLLEPSEKRVKGKLRLSTTRLDVQLKERKWITTTFAQRMIRLSTKISIKCQRG